MKTLENTVQQKGDHSVVWYGKDDQNKDAASGVYFFKVNLGQEKYFRKAILLK